MFRMVSACPTCRGRGTVVAERCDDCRGHGRATAHRSLLVRIPAGIGDGQAIRVTGEGEPPSPEVSPDGSGTPGDLHVVIRVQSDERFERDGDNLIVVEPVAFTQLAIGATVTIDTLDGRHELEIPAGTQTNELFRIAAAGLPNLRSGKRGDMVVIVRLVVPRKLTERQRALLGEYAETEDTPVNETSGSFWEKFKDVVTGGRSQDDKEQ